MASLPPLRTTASSARTTRPSAAAITKAIGEGDDATRTQDWKDAMKLVNADVPDVPLVWAGSYLAATTHVHGYIPSPTQSEYFNLVWKDAGS